MNTAPYGTTEHVAPGIRKLLAPNPGPMTGAGTNTYLIGDGACAVIDPGPADPRHLDALLTATQGNISHILITHAHRDHTGLVLSLRDATNAPVLAFGRADEGRSEVMSALAADGLSGGGEGIDADFTPDQRIGDGDQIRGDDWTLDVLHTPGHLSGHLCFRLGDILFSGDHIMDWSTTVISPPDGDLGAFMASTRRLQGIGLQTLLPGHGPAVESPDTRLSDLLAHRENRERQIITALREGAATVEQITQSIYTDISPTLLPAASRNVFAHLIDLTTRNRVSPTPNLAPSARFSLI